MSDLVSFRNRVFFASLLVMLLFSLLSLQISSAMQSVPNTEKLDLLILVDISERITTQEASHASRAVRATLRWLASLTRLNGEKRVGIYCFGTGVEEVRALTAVDVLLEDWDNLNTGLQDCESSPYTDFVQTLDDASEILVTESESEARKAILFLTDGLPDSPNYLDGETQLAKLAAEIDSLSSEMAIRVSFLFISSDYSSFASWEQMPFNFEEHDQIEDLLPTIFGTSPPPVTTLPTFESTPSVAAPLTVSPQRSAQPSDIATAQPQGTSMAETSTPVTPEPSATPVASSIGLSDWVNWAQEEISLFRWYIIGGLLILVGLVFGRRILISRLGRLSFTRRLAQHIEAKDFDSARLALENHASYHDNKYSKEYIDFYTRIEVKAYESSLNSQQPFEVLDKLVKDYKKSTGYRKKATPLAVRGILQLAVQNETALPPLIIVDYLTKQGLPIWEASRDEDYS